MPPGALVKSDPAVSKPNWLPEGFWPRLDELRTEHRAAIERMETARTEASELGARFKAEDETRERAYRTGLETPEVTDPAERDRLVAEARSRFEAAEKEFKETADRVLREIQDAEADWQADLNRRRSEADQKRAEARAALAEADEATAKLTILSRWLRRTAENRAWRQVPYESLGVPAPLAGHQPSAFNNDGDDGEVHELEEVGAKPAPTYPVGEPGEIL